MSMMAAAVRVRISGQDSALEVVRDTSRQEAICAVEQAVGDRESDCVPPRRPGLSGAPKEAGMQGIETTQVFQHPA
jgi:hypothetical protein